ncbi:anti-sigma-F factor Fin family protein [Robertmurraya sp. DFI.2.37]|uniref:anti-sigma-F factor Fin family protein n=1 Tax=Robertmurraya sp. DFI.2.37 TaxID=3031819 RepID=UPI001243C023|nr:anti-sigma-F factor Fin family protein [Robertmurraya sp. DFI.2.37]MDF1509525.1 anti-sigma-F factor Fin family protein [Robertmurraya sp. DFI.2.37]
MALKYYCRHCGVQMGRIDDMSVDMERLGLHKLTNEERMEMVSYDLTGDVHIKSICEDCHESLERNPAFYQNDYLIH